MSAGAFLNSCRRSQNTRDYLPHDLRSTGKHVVTPNRSSLYPQPLLNSSENQLLPTSLFSSGSAGEMKCSSMSSEHQAVDYWRPGLVF